MKADKNLRHAQEESESRRRLLTFGKILINPQPVKPRIQQKDDEEKDRSAAEPLLPFSGTGE